MPLSFAARFTFAGPNPIDAFIFQDSIASGPRIGFVLQATINYGSPLWIWTAGGYSADHGYVSPTWPDPASPPWGLLGYWGPFASSSQDVSRFCTMCGAARASLDARFCANCGAAIGTSAGQLPDLKSQVREATQSAYGAASLVMEIVNTYVIPRFPAPAGSLVAQKLAEVLRQSPEVSYFFADGEAADNTRLSMGAMQALAAKAGQHSPLSAQELQQAGEILRSAPIRFGYWGPFKSLLKSMSPALAPEDFGVALGRLSLAAMGGIPEPAVPSSMQDLSWLWPAVAIPGRGTLSYMERRMRRQLATLGDADPRLYAQVAAHTLIAWDGRVGSRSFLPAYIMGGGSQVLNVDSRAVAIPFTQVEPHYAHPSAWSDNLDLIGVVLDRIKSSPEALTFCLQVLRANGRPAPALNPTTLALAFLSTDPATVQQACDALVLIPDAWDSLPRESWITFFRMASSTSLAKVGASLLGRAPRLSIAQACNHVLYDQDQTDTDRLLPISQVYLAYCHAEPGWIFSEDAAERAIKITGRHLDFGISPETWRPMLASYKVTTLLHAYLALAADEGAPVGSVDLLEELVLQAAESVLPDSYFYTPGYPTRGWDALLFAAYLALSSPSPRAFDLGWRLFDRLTGPANGYPQWLGGESAASAAAEQRVWSWLKEPEEEEATNPQWREQRLAIIRGLLSRSATVTERVTELLMDPAWGFTPSELARFLEDDREAALLAWGALSGESSGVVRDAALSDASLLRVIGDAVPAEATATASATQVEALLAYISANPERIRSEPRFGVAVASMPAPDIQRVALSQLTENGALAQWWLPLAESGLPLPLTAAQGHVETLQDSSDFTDAVLAAIDSGVAVVRDMGVTLLDQNDPRLDQDRAWDALLHSDDQRIQARVAEETLVRRWADDDALAAFDRRLLVTRRRNRRAKEFVKQRLVEEEQDQMTPSTLVLAPERMNALLELSQSANPRDREWALRRLAILSLQGIDVVGVDVSLVTTGGDDGQL